MMKKKGTKLPGRKGSVDFSSDCLKEGPGQWNSPAPSLVFLAFGFFLTPDELVFFPTGNWDKTVDLSDMGPSHIINIKKEKRETDEETKQILRMLEKDDVGASMLWGTALLRGCGKGLWAPGLGEEELSDVLEA